MLSSGILTRAEARISAVRNGSGRVHCYWTGLKGTNVQGRFLPPSGYLDAIKKIGVEVGARRTKTGMEVEFSSMGELS